MKKLELFFIMALLILTPFASADIPHLISLQGKLTDASDNPISSSTNFAFRIYDVPTGGTALWTEFQTITPDTLGIFSALLGSVTALNIPFNTSYWLEVQVNSEILSPRTRMGSAGYALRSESPWNATGNNIYTTNAGNVGIGTSSPAQKLTVSGDVSWTGNLLGGSVPWARLSNIPNYAGSSSQGGPATTATALASNGANCGAGQYSQGVDAGGNAEGCSAPSGGTKVFQETSGYEGGIGVQTYCINKGYLRAVILRYYADSCAVPYDCCTSSNTLFDWTHLILDTDNSAIYAGTHDGYCTPGGGQYRQTHNGFQVMCSK